MLTYWETLIAARSNITVSDSYAKLWGRKLSNAYSVATYTGTLPATLQTVEGYLKGYKIYGNTVQDGTPTPENPIMPIECGELETTGAHAGQYKLPILSNSTVTDIYIGDTPLAKDEYVSYPEQKIYRRTLFIAHDNKHFITKDNKDFCLRRESYNG